VLLHGLPDHGLRRPANRKEIEAMFELFFKEKADERPTKPAVDPKAGEAHL
jgi:hypothetical protein